ncbi:hypothetical protein CsSME_00007069 [Camellia sinensis var. sinensis]
MISWVKIVVDFLDLLLIKWKEEWNRPLHTLNAQQDHKLMFGLLFSLKSLTAKMDPTSAEKGNLGVPQLPGQGCSFHSFCTNTYKLSFMESPSGMLSSQIWM